MVGYSKWSHLHNLYWCRWSSFTPLVSQTPYPHHPRNLLTCSATVTTANVRRHGRGEHLQENLIIQGRGLFLCSGLHSLIYNHKNCYQQSTNWSKPTDPTGPANPSLKPFITDPIDVLKIHKHAGNLETSRNLHIPDQKNNSLQVR